MGNDMRIEKFEVLVSEIIKSGDLATIYFDTNSSVPGTMPTSWGIWANDEKCKAAQTYLASIYDYNSLNDYGKVIMRQAYKQCRGIEWRDDKECKDIEVHRDMKEKIENIKELSKAVNKQVYNTAKKAVVKSMGISADTAKSNTLKVMFLAMMILTVDSADKEERLSLVCDLARMLRVSDEEVMDILQILQIIYRKEENDVKFLSESVPDCFRGILDRYSYT